MFDYHEEINNIIKHIYVIFNIFVNILTKHDTNATDNKKCLNSHRIDNFYVIILKNHNSNKIEIDIAQYWTDGHHYYFHNCHKDEMNIRINFYEKQENIILEIGKGDCINELFHADRNLFLISHKHIPWINSGRSNENITWYKLEIHHNVNNNNSLRFSEIDTSFFKQWNMNDWFFRKINQIVHKNIWFDYSTK